jgi:hypothetical protein
MSLQIINENIDTFNFYNETKTGYNATIKLANESQLHTFIAFISARWNNYINDSIINNDTESWGLIKISINSNVTIYCYLHSDFTQDFSNKMIIIPRIYYIENNQKKLFTNLTKYNSERYCTHINWNNLAYETLSPHIKRWFDINISNRDIMDEKRDLHLTYQEVREINSRYHDNMSQIDLLSAPGMIPSYRQPITETKIIKTLPNHIIDLVYIGMSHSGKSVTCPVCLDTITSEQFTVSHCGHEYCKSCLSVLNKCAVCRSN